MKKDYILRFENTDFCEGDKNHLLEVNFKNGDKIFHWYPKWKDLMQVLSDTMATEGILNNGKQLNYLLYMIFYILTTRLCADGISLDTIKLYHKISNLIQRELLNKPGDNNA